VQDGARDKAQREREQDGLSNAIADEGRRAHAAKKRVDERSADGPHGHRNPEGM
jgi:hypothetical protein